MNRFLKPRRSTLVLAAALAVLPQLAGAQQKQRFASLDEALQAQGILQGRSGPRSVNWIEGGARFSFIDRDAQNRPVIKAYDPATGAESVLFTTAGTTFPGTATPFEYECFQWTRDFKHLVFQSNFQPHLPPLGHLRLLHLLAGRPRAAAGRRAARAPPSSSPDGTHARRRARRRHVRRRPRHAAREAADERRHRARLQRPLRLGVRRGVRPRAGVELVARQPAHRVLAGRRAQGAGDPAHRLTAARTPDWDSIRIPQPGDTNPTRAHRRGRREERARRSGSTPAIAGEFYIPRIYWTSRADTLAMITLNRRAERDEAPLLRREHRRLAPGDARDVERRGSTCTTSTPACRT